ncbi:MAG: hypothetical protein RL413_916, partial [Actinomycetota bacterium]
MNEKGTSRTIGLQVDAAHQGVTENEGQDVVTETTLR